MAEPAMGSDRPVSASAPAARTPVRLRLVSTSTMFRRSRMPMETAPPVSSANAFISGRACCRSPMEAISG